MHSIFHKKAKPILCAEEVVVETYIHTPEQVSVTVPKKAKKPKAPTKPRRSKKKSDIQSFAQEIVEEIADVDDDDDTEESSPSPPIVKKSAARPSQSATNVPPAPLTSLAPPAPIKNRIQTVQNFWEYINRLEWRDRSDGHVSSAAINNLTAIERQSWNAFFNQNLNALENKLNISRFFDQFGVTDPVLKKTIMCHIIAKGRQFYIAVLDDPVFTEYLVGSEPQEFQIQSSMLSNLGV
jgi:hypothetical protein